MYQPNKFVKNDEKDGDDKKKYIVYIGPFLISCFCEKMTFNEINQLEKIPDRSEKGSNNYPRFAMNYFAKTWIRDDPKDKNWFDERDTFEKLKGDLIERLQSQYLPNNSRKYSYFAA